MQDFASLLIRGRSRLGLDQVEFGRRVGVGQQAVSRWERGGSRPRRAVVVKVAQVLELPVDEVLAAAGYVGALADSPHEISPAVRPLARTLPFHELSPERFEDVCVEFLEHMHPGGHASRYGGSGERQDGIDLLLTLDGHVHATGQCKRHKQFGPKDIGSVVADVANPASINYLFLSRQTATAAARREMAKHASWQLWDGEDLSRYIRTQMSEDERLRFVDAHFPNHREPFLGIAQPGPWLSIAEFFATTSRTQPFSHDWTLCGRSEERANLESGLRAGDDAVAVVLGRGGIGKTRLLRSVAETFDAEGWYVRILPPDSAPDSPSFELLPAHGPALLIIDDAHDRTDMGHIITNLRARNRSARLLVACRPYGKQRLEEDLRRVGLDLWDLPTVTLGDLTHDESSMLAREALGPDNSMFAERLALLTRDCPLATTVGGYLIRTRTLDPRELEQDERIRERILSGFRNALVDASAHGERELRSAIIDAVSVLQPFRSNTPEFQDAIARLVGARYSRISPHLRSLEDAGVLLRRNDSLRLVPDLLGDVVLSEACFDRRTGVDSGYLGEVLEIATGEVLENAFVNVSRVDWQVRYRLTQASASFWRVIQASLEQRDIETYLKVLKLLRRVAVFQTEQSIRVVRWIMDHPVADEAATPDDPSGFFKWTWRHVLEEIPAILRATSFSLESIVVAANILWELAQTDRRATNQYPNHPMRVLHELAAYAPHKPIEYNKRILELAESWTKQEWTLSPLTVIEPLIATEGHTTEYRDHALSFGAFGLQQDVVSPVRQRTVELALGEIESEDPIRGVAGARFIQTALHYPTGAFGRTVDESELRSWDVDFADTLQSLLDLLRSRTLDPVVCVAVLEAAHWHAHYGIGAPRSVAEAVIAAMPDTVAFEIALLLHDGWGRLVRTRGMAVDEYMEATKQRLEHVATRALNELDDASLIQLIEDRLHQESTTFDRASTGGTQLLNALIEKRPSIATALIESLFANPDSAFGPLTSRLIDSLGRWQPDILMPSVQRLLLHPSTTVVTETAVGLAARDRTQYPLHVNELEMLQTWAASPDQRIREAVAQAAFNLAATDRTVAKSATSQKKLSAAADLLSRIRFYDSPSVADRVFTSLTWDDSPIFWDDLNSQQQSAILDQLANLPDIDNHSIKEFIFLRSTEEPQRILRLLRTRIEVSENLTSTTSITSNKGFKPVPFEWHRELVRRDHPDFLAILRDLIVWISQGNSWQRQRMGSKLFAAAAGAYDEPVLSLLLETLRADGQQEALGVAHVLAEAPNDLVFVHVEFVVQALALAARVGPDISAAIQNSLWASAVQGVRWGTCGEPYAEDLRLRDECARIAQALPPKTDAAVFYSRLSDSAVQSISHETERYQADGREW
ncbi:helix-turn-helix domain-containing protein [Nocardia sp. SC052]|uniref:P-loop NTPase n=1 Tax=Nocardia sichangensis TaxID=3385975 RepID=UPI0039A20A33